MMYRPLSGRQLPGGMGRSAASAPASKPGSKELVTNGGFDANIDSWSQIAGTDITISWSAGAMRMVRGAGAAGGHPYQAIATDAGRRYRIVVTCKAGQSAMNFRVGNSAGGQDLLTGQNLNAGSTFSGYFVATGSAANVAMWPLNSSTTADVELVSIKLA